MRRTGSVPDSTPKRLLSKCVTSYLAEIREHKARRTLAAYTVTLNLFTESLEQQEAITPEAVERKHIEDITREEVLAYASFLRKRGNAPRTIRNRVNFFQIFLHHFGLPSLLKGKNLPTYTEKEVRAYNVHKLGLMFDHTTQDESDLLHFLLCTGTREQEAQFLALIVGR